MYDADKDERLDPRARAFLALLPSGEERPDVESRAELLAEANSEEGRALAASFLEMSQILDDVTLAPKDGLRIADFTLTSAPDGNAVNLRFIRPDNDDVVGCVYYIHGGGMASMSCHYGNYQTWARLLAHEGVGVAMIDFRNCVSPSSVPEVAPYPAGLNDCASGLAWLHEHAGELGVDAARVVAAGESGGGNLTLALGLRLNREGRLDLVKGLYALAPYIAGYWPQERYPSSIENNGIFINVHGNRGRMGYGIDAYEAQDPLAWPGLAGDDDVRGLVPTVINVNECDPLRDEGIGFYRLLVRNGVAARCRQVMGTIHANELVPAICPDVTLDAVRDLAAFCRG
jgi:acetyl esterase/lipase